MTFSEGSGICLYVCLVVVVVAICVCNRSEI